MGWLTLQARTKHLTLARLAPAFAGPSPTGGAGQRANGDLSAWVGFFGAMATVAAEPRRAEIFNLKPP